MMISKKKKYRWLFVQLPVISHDFVDNFAHLPYGSLVVSSYLSHKIKHIDAIRIDKKMECIGADSLIINKIVEFEPDFLCFSLYLWNTERSIYIAKKIKDILPDTIIIFGGPEVNLNNSFLLENSIFDIGIIGEGEECICQIANFLLSYKKHEIIKNVFDRNNLYLSDNKIFIGNIDTDLLAIPPVYKYREHISYDNTIFIESLRGCPGRCTYCYYQKNFTQVKYFPLSRVIQEIKWAIKNGVLEIDFIDPSFLRRKNLIDFLEDIYSIIKNANAPEFFCELNAEDVSDEIANMLLKINVKKVEVGLQTTNLKALKLINRKFDVKKFISGIDALKKRDIEILLDLIVGLPSDTYQDVLRSIEFVKENDLMDEIGIYPLSILPGTALRKDAKNMGIKYQFTPPYLVEKTDVLSKEEISSIFNCAEEILDMDLFPREFPLIGIDEDLFVSNAEPVYLLDLTHKGTSLEDFIKNNFKKLACSILIRILDERWLLRDELVLLYRAILQENPYILVDILISQDIIEKIPLQEVLNLLKPVMISRDFYMDRIYVDTIDNLRTTQIFLNIKGPQDTDCTLSIPSTWYSNKDPVFWFMIKGKEDVEIEQYFIERLAYLLGVDVFNYRISYENKKDMDALKKICPLGKAEIYI